MSFHPDAVGRGTSHVSVGALDDDKTYFDTTLVVGRGSDDQTAITGQWSTMPDVPPPDDCKPIPFNPDFRGFALGHSERRIALGPHPWVTTAPGPGRVATWFKLVDADTSSPGGLAWAADCVALGFAQSVGSLTRATSLDNTIRYAARRESEWILIDAIAEGASQGYAFGRVNLFATDGTLLAVGTQTCLARRGSSPFVSK